MPTNNIQLPGYRQNEYLLILQPHEELRNKIVKIKEGFAKQYNDPLALKLKPHMALASFTAFSMMEEKIVQRLLAISMGIIPFKVELKDYAGFPSHTIYIKTATRTPLQHLIKEIKTAQRLLKTSSTTKPHFMEDPHIALSRKLKPWQYEQGWQEFSHRQFTGRFIADAMLLLKRPAGEKYAWQIVRRLEFLNQAVSIRQASLFAWPL
jgi:2'-5' RNA ligase